jgi:hypothetical protein
MWDLSYLSDLNPPPFPEQTMVSRLSALQGLLVQWEQSGDWKITANEGRGQRAPRKAPGGRSAPSLCGAVIGRRGFTEEGRFLTCRSEAREEGGGEATGHEGVSGAGWAV